MPILKNYLCCLSLKRGTLSIGVCGLVYEIVLLIIMFTSNVRLSPVLVPSTAGLITKISVIVEVVIVVCVSVILIIGAVKEQRFLLLPWLVVSVVTITGLFIAHIYTIAVTYDDGNYLGGTVLIGYCVAVTGISIYFWLVVLSFYQELTEARNQQQRLNNS